MERNIKFYKAMEFVNEDRIKKDDYEEFTNLAKELIEKNVLDENEKNIIYIYLLKVYIGQYNYKEAEKIAEAMYKVDMECLSHILGEYYIYTRRYDKAEYVLKKALIKEVNNEERELIEEKINDCEKRKNQYKKEYIPNPIEGKNQYKDFMKEIGIDVNIEIRTL